MKKRRIIRQIRIICLITARKHIIRAEEKPVLIQRLFTVTIIIRKLFISLRDLRSCFGKGRNCQMYNIGIDLGGTNIAAGIVDENGQRLSLIHSSDYSVQQGNRRHTVHEALIFYSPSICSSLPHLYAT